MSDGGERRLALLAGTVEQVWRCYPQAALGGSLVALGNRGGFSEARLWYSEGALGAMCLRAWPAHKPADWVRRLHRLMQFARQQGLDFIPAVHAARTGDTVVEAAGRVWELTQWLPGRADFAERPSAVRLHAACQALARLHRTWEPFATAAEPCPAVQRRRRVLSDWQALVTTGWRPQASLTAFFPPLWPLVERAWQQLPAWLRSVPDQLTPWLEYRPRVQPCLCDLWHDHLLFEGDHLTGLVDYGAVKPDHVAVDLARMLGSLVGDDRHRWDDALRSYRGVRALSDTEAELARVLDRTGTVLGVVNWLRLLYYERRPYDDLAAVARRLESLLERIERWTA